jgi:NADH-quinone oxidoreductase subunit G
LREADGRGVVSLVSARAAAAALAAADTTGARFVLATRRAGDRGALAAGVTRARPRRPTSRRPGERDELERVWGGDEDRAWSRRDRYRRAAAARELDVLYLVGSTLRDVPTRARAARCRTCTVVVQSLELATSHPS